MCWTAALEKTPEANAHGVGGGGCDGSNRLAEQSERLAGDEVPGRKSAGIVLRVPEERAERPYGVVERGSKCLLIPIEEGNPPALTVWDQTL